MNQENNYSNSFNESYKNLKKMY